MNAVGKVTNGKFEEFANTKKGGSQDLSELTGRVATAEEDISKLKETVQDLGYIDCEVNAIADNVVQIPNAPESANYIPIVTGSSNTLITNINIYWREQFKIWIVYTGVTQTVNVGFYKYPI